MKGKQKKQQVVTPTCELGHSLVISCPQVDYVAGFGHDMTNTDKEECQQVAPKITKFVTNNSKEFDEILVIMDTHVDRKKFRAKDSYHLDFYGEHCTSGSYGWKVYDSLATVLSQIEKEPRVRYIQKDTLGKKLRFLPDTSHITVMGYYLDLDILSLCCHMLDDYPGVNIHLGVDYTAPTRHDLGVSALDLLSHMGVDLW